MEHTPISPEEAADRLAIRELVDTYAHRADRRDAGGQEALFAEDTHFAVYMNGANTEPTEDLHGREQLTGVVVKRGGTWLFAERSLYLEFSDTRTLGG